MKVFGFNISIQRDQAAAVKREASVSPFSPEFWPEDGVCGTVLSNAYEQVVWVYRAVNALAEQVSAYSNPPGAGPGDGMYRVRLVM